MELLYQDLEWAIFKTTRLFTKNPRRSISATFRMLRKNPNLSYIGCYPILSAIVTTTSGLKIVFSRNSVKYALNKSEELRDLRPKVKTAILNQLVNPISVDFNRTDIATKRPKDQKRHVDTSQAQKVKK